MAPATESAPAAAPEAAATSNVGINAVLLGPPGSGKGTQVGLWTGFWWTRIEGEGFRFLGRLRKTGMGVDREVKIYEETFNSEGCLVESCWRTSYGERVKDIDFALDSWRSSSWGWFGFEGVVRWRMVRGLCVGRYCEGTFREGVGKGTLMLRSELLAQDVGKMD